MPSVEELQALSAEKMGTHTLTHILHDSGWMRGFSLKFSDGSISPKKGNYIVKSSAKVDVPIPPKNPRLRRGSTKSTFQTDALQMALFKPKTHPIVEQLQNLDLNLLAPLDALNLLYELKNKADLPTK